MNQQAFIGPHTIMLRLKNGFGSVSGAHVIDFTFSKNEVEPDSFVCNGAFRLPISSYADRELGR